MRKVWTAMHDPGGDRGMLASSSLPAHLARGAVGFGLLGAAVVLGASHEPVALLLAATGMVALRGCPTCWLAGLAQTVSAGRLQRTCTESGCTLVPAGRTRTPATVSGGPAKTVDEADGTRLT
jgi:hypothetical protein